MTGEAADTTGPAVRTVVAGIVTASIASWLIDSVRETETSLQGATRADVAVLSARIEDLHRVLADMQPRLA